MTIWAECGAIITDSQLGADNFLGIWAAAACGNSIDAIDNNGEVTAFSLDGIAELLGSEPCHAVGNS